MPRVGTTARGSLIAVIQVVPPKDLTAEQLDDIRKIVDARGEKDTAGEKDAAGEPKTKPAQDGADFAGIRKKPKFKGRGRRNGRSK